MTRIKLVAGYVREKKEHIRTNRSTCTSWSWGILQASCALGERYCSENQRSTHEFWFDKLRVVTELANVGRKQEVVLATVMAEEPGSYKKFANWYVSYFNTISISVLHFLYLFSILYGRTDQHHRIQIQI